MRIVIIIMLALAGTASGAGPSHDAPGAARCLDCHTRLPFPGREQTYNETMLDLCLGCHRGRQGAMASHPVGVIPSMPVPRDMVLDAGGRMTCATCHLFHRDRGNMREDRPSTLRRPRGKALCRSCHKTP